MNEIINHVTAILDICMEIKVKKNHFPHRANIMYRNGIVANTWILPSCQSIYTTNFGSVTFTGEPLTTFPVVIPDFCEEKLFSAIKNDQAGQCSFREFLLNIWCAGVVRYDVNFSHRTVTYYGVSGDEWEESYPEVTTS